MGDQPMTQSWEMRGLLEEHSGQNYCRPWEAENLYVLLHPLRPAGGTVYPLALLWGLCYGGTIVWKLLGGTGSGFITQDRGWPCEWFYFVWLLLKNGSWFSYGDTVPPSDVRVGGGGLCTLYFYVLFCKYYE